MQIRPTYISTYNYKRDNHVNLLMITDNNNNNCHYLAIKSIPGLLRGITSNHAGHFYYLNCFHSHTTKNKLKRYEKYAKIMIFVM